METDGSPSFTAASPTSAWNWFDRVFMSRRQPGLPALSPLRGRLKESFISKARMSLNDMSELLAGKSYSLSCPPPATNQSHNVCTLIFFLWTKIRMTTLAQSTKEHGCITWRGPSKRLVLLSGSFCLIWRCTHQGPWLTTGAGLTLIWCKVQAWSGCSVNSTVYVAASSF